MSTPYFHGVISREEAEQRLMTAHLRNPTEPVFLVRNSSKNPEECVLSTLIDHGTVKFGHFKIRNVGVVGRSAFQLELTQTDPPTFPSVELLLSHYTDPQSGHPAPIGMFVPAPAVVANVVPVAAVIASRQAVASPPAAAAAAAAPTRAAPPPAAPSPAAAPPLPARVSNPAVAPTPSSAPPPAAVVGAVAGAAVAAPLSAPSAPAASSEDGAEELLCEGYLTKTRGVGSSRIRFFSLTTKKLMYFTVNAGELIASVLFSDIAAVTELDKKTFRLITREPFGQSSKTEMIVEAPSLAVRNKWMTSLRGTANAAGGLRELQGRLVVEGYLTKVQPMGSSSKERWFACTSEVFAYFKEEAGEMMSSVPIANILSVGGTGDPKCFKVISNTRFTVTGSYEVLCRAETEAVRNKWLQQMMLVIPKDKFPQN